MHTHHADAWHHFTPYVITPRPRRRWAMLALAIAVTAIAAGAFYELGREPAPKVLQTDITQLRVSGPLPLERASALVERQRDRLDLCFRQAGVLEAGTLSAKLLLGTDGLARLVQVVPGKGNLGPAGSCIGRVLGSIYTAGGREVTLEFAVNLREVE